MKIYEFLWPEDRVAHIAQHGVRPEEVEDVCFGRALVQRTKSAGANPVYYVLGQTAAGRYLFCVVIEFPDGMHEYVTTPVKRVLRLAGREVFYIETINSRYRLEVRGREDAVAESAG